MVQVLYVRDVAGAGRGIECTATARARHILILMLKYVRT